MESESMNDLINKVKSNNQQNKIQKIVPVSNKEIEEVQFSFMKNTLRCFSRSLI